MNYHVHHTLDGQPNDHLDLIVRLLEGQDLYRLMRVNHRLASFAVRHLPAAQAHHDKILEDAVNVMRKTKPFKCQMFVDLVQQYVVPGVTVATLGAGRDRWTGMRRYIRDEQIDLISARCGPALRVLSVGSQTSGTTITDGAVERLVVKCSRLTRLDLGNCTFLTDQAVEAIATNCTGLVDLELCGCKQLTDHAVEVLVESCHQLKGLRLDRCILLTDQSLLHIAWGCTGLKVLVVGCCGKFTDLGIDAIATNCVNLACLDLRWCKQITDSTVNIVASKCRKLRALFLDGCRQLSDTSVEVLATSCRTLKDLRMSYTAVTDHALTLVVLAKTKLVKLDVDRTRVTDQGREAFKRVRPGIALN